MQSPVYQAGGAHGKGISEPQSFSAMACFEAVEGRSSAGTRFFDKAKVCLAQLV